MIKKQNALLQKIIETFGKSIRCIVDVEGVVE